MKWIITKYLLEPSTILHLPRGASILGAQPQGEYIYLSLMHDAREDHKEKRSFIVKKDEEEFENPPEGYRLKYVDTVQMATQSRITGVVQHHLWYVFEVEKVGLMV